MDIRKNKYGNKKVTVDGIKFDSQLEANRYCELKILERAGEIKDLRRQIKFELQPSYIKNNKSIQSINYIADFVYYDVNKKKFIVEDVKSEATKTQVYKLKKKLFEYKYDLEIKEIME